MYISCTFIVINFCCMHLLFCGEAIKFLYNPCLSFVWLVVPVKICIMFVPF